MDKKSTNTKKMELLKSDIKKNTTPKDFANFLIMKFTQKEKVKNALSEIDKNLN